MSSLSGSFNRNGGGDVRFIASRIASPQPLGAFAEPNPTAPIPLRRCIALGFRRLEEIGYMNARTHKHTARRGVQ